MVEKRANGRMIEILWHRQGIRRQTEETNLNLIVSGEASLLDLFYRYYDAWSSLGKGIAIRKEEKNT